MGELSGEVASVFVALGLGASAAGALLAEPVEALADALHLATGRLCTAPPPAGAAPARRG